MLTSIKTVNFLPSHTTYHAQDSNGKIEMVFSRTNLIDKDPAHYTIKLCHTFSNLKEGQDPIHKLLETFRPLHNQLGRLSANRPPGHTEIELNCKSSPVPMSIRFNEKAEGSSHALVRGMESWDYTMRSTYIPDIDITPYAKGFISLYNSRDITFSGVYADLLSKAYMPPLRNVTGIPEYLLDYLEGLLGGKPYLSGETFLLKGKNRDTEFTLLPSGIRKLALLWLLIRNGMVGNDTILFMENPEAGMPIDLLPSLIHVITALTDIGQVFLSTQNEMIAESQEVL